MASFLFSLKFFGGIILLFAIGGLVGHLLKLDKYLEEKHHDRNEDIQQVNYKDD